MKNSLHELYIILEKVKESAGNIEDKLIETNLPWQMGEKTDCNKVVMSSVICRKISVVDQMHN